MDSETLTITQSPEPSYLKYLGKGRGIKSWIFSTDHKRIGLLYLISLLSFFAVGVTFGFLMRLELISARQYNNGTSNI